MDNIPQKPMVKWENIDTVGGDRIVESMRTVLSQSSDGIGTSVIIAPRFVVECWIVNRILVRVVNSNFDVFCNYKMKGK